jgi:alcohol dehydrogenase class IV
MDFNFAATPHILFGEGKFNSLPKIVSQYGERVLMVTGSSSFLSSKYAKSLVSDFDMLNITKRIVQIEEEPSPDDVDEAVQEHKQFAPHLIVAIGGGSVLDAGKAISAMLREEGSIVDYLEGIGAREASGKKVPLVAVPTTSGTGSECTKNAVISRRGEGGFKKSLRHNNYVPDIALVDPALTLNCPPSVTAASGMDAFTQLLESYLSTSSTPLTDALALDALQRLMNSIETAVEDGSNLAARADMSYAAMVSGITLANAGLGVVHGFAQPLGSLHPVPHGIVCGTLMGAANLVSLEFVRKLNNETVLSKYEKVAQLIAPHLKGNEATDFLIKYIEKLSSKFQLPKLSEFGINEAHFPEIIKATSLKNHPAELNNDDLWRILKLCL